MIFFANRASTILCNYLKSKAFPKPFLLPANACPVLPLTFLKAGISFEFVDIDESHAMSKDIAKEKISSNEFSGLVFVHAYGKRFDNAAFYREVKHICPDCCIIDDRCLCQPELSDELPVNTDLVLYSTGYAKYVELMHGGFGITDYKIDCSFRYEYSESEETRQQTYIKERLNDGGVYELADDFPWLNGAPLQYSQEEYIRRIQDRIPEMYSQKDCINTIYRTNLPKDIQWGADYDNWRFMVSVNNRDKVLDAIFNNGLFAGANYPSVSYLFKKQHSPQAEEESKHTLNLLNNHRVDEAFALKLCEVINSNI